MAFAAISRSRTAHAIRALGSTIVVPHRVRSEDLGTNAAALESLHADRPFYKPSTLVATNDPTEIAGDTILPDAAAAPDPVTPGFAPAPAAFAWRVSGHTAPSWSWLVDPVAHALVFVARNRFVLMPVLILGGILIGVVGSGDKARPLTPAMTDYPPEPPSRRAHRWMMVPLCIGTAMLNLLFGTWVSGLIVYSLGAEGQATITGSHSTGTIYNSHL